MFRAGDVIMILRTNFMETKSHSYGVTVHRGTLNKYVLVCISNSALGYQTGDFLYKFKNALLTIHRF